MFHTHRLLALALVGLLATLPACGAAALLAPLIEAGIDEIFKDDQKGDQVPDDTPIGEAVDLEIALGGRVACDPADGVNQRVTIVTIRHTGAAGSSPITYTFLPETDTKLTADPSTGTLAPGEVENLEIYADDCDFFVQEFRVRTYFTGEQGVPGKSTTTLLTVRNVIDDEEPMVAAFLSLLADSDIQEQLSESLALVPYGEPVKHGSEGVPDRIPDIPLSQIGYYGSLEVNLDATELEEAFTGAGADFPVGAHADGTVYEAETTAAMTPGDYRFIFFGLDGSFNLIDSSRYWRFAVVADSDGQAANNLVPAGQFPNDPFRGTDRWYILDYVPGNGWDVRLIDATGTELASAVRVIQVADALLFVIPKSEIPGPGAGYRVVSFTHTGDEGQGADHDWSGDHHPASDLSSLPD